MDETRKHIIILNLDFLCQNTKSVLQISNNLRSKGIFTEHDVDSVMSKPTDYERNSHFYNLVIRKGPKAFKILILALEKSGNGTSARKLIQEINFSSDDEPLSEFSGISWFECSPPVDNFTGRSVELESLSKFSDSIYGRSEKKPESLNNYVIITGMGGVGKSELVRHFARNQFQNGTTGHCFWINCENIAAALDSYKRLSPQLGIPILDSENKEKSIRILIQDILLKFMDEKYLIVLDNVEDFDGPLKVFHDTMGCQRPGFPKPLVVITSRNRELMPATSLDIDLDVFSPEISREFVLKSIPAVCIGVEPEVKKSESPDGRQDIKISVSQSVLDDRVDQLGQLLQYFPLALQQATSYIIEENQVLMDTRNSNYTIVDYINRYEMEKRKFLSHSSNKYMRSNNYTSTTYTTWRITISRFKQLQFGEEALQILNRIAYFSPDRIETEHIFKYYEKCVRNSETNPEDCDDRFIMESYLSVGQITQALVLLKKYSMVKLNGGVMRVHRLIQEVIQLDLEDTNSNLQILTEMSISFQNQLMISTESKHSGRDHYFVNHAIKIWKHICSINEDEIRKDLIVKFPYLAILITQELEDLIRYEESIEFAVHGIENLKQYVSREDPNLLRLQYRLFKGCVLTEQYNTCKEIFGDIYDNFVLTFGLKHRLTLNFRCVMAFVFQDSGEFDKAFDLLTKCLADTVEFGEEHTHTLIIKSRTIPLLRQQGKITEAWEVCQKTLPVAKNILRSDHEISISIKRDMGLILFARRNYTKALKLFLRVHKVQGRDLGLHNPRTLTTRNNICVVLQNLGKFNESFEIINSIKVNLDNSSMFDCSIFSRTRLITMMSEARFFNRQGKFSKAKELQRKVVEIGEMKYGSDHEVVLRAKGGLGEVLILEGSFNEAVDLLEEVLETHRRIFGDRNLYTSTIKSYLGRALWGIKCYERALDLFIEIVQTHEKSNSDETQLEVVLEANMSIIRLLAEQGSRD